MSSHTLICICGWIASSVCCHANIQLTAGTAIHFASPAEGSKILMVRDDFIRRLSPFDRAARVKVDRAVSEEEFLTFVGRNVAEWTKEEMQTVQSSVESLRPLLRAFPLSLPSTIQMIKTTGAEEGNAAYTRGTAIVLPTGELAKSQEELNKLICHELFHILSRHNPELRERLYEAIGFTRCDEIEFPRELAPRKITNPDAPRNDHFIRLTDQGQQCLAVPILLSSAEVYDVKRGGEFFEYLNFQFIMMAKTSNPDRLKPQYENSMPKLVRLEEISGFFEQVGRNTHYIIHPEEVLADNFALLVLKQQNVPSPQILQKMMQLLLEPNRPNHAMEPTEGSRK
jgi:hypothetical protein